MLTPTRRRFLLGTLLALGGAACGRVVPGRPSPPPEPSLTGDFNGWRQEAQGILSDALQALRTFDGFHAFRVSTAAESGMRLGSELAWDAPTSAAWDEATHVARGLRGRAEQLFVAVTTSHVDPDLWREQRAIADRTGDLVDLGSALNAYRDRIDRIGGDATGALAQLDQVWGQWEAAAARWGISRAESIGCRA
jgi:hypothetical protein